MVLRAHNQFMSAVRRQQNRRREPVREVLIRPAYPDDLTVLARLAQLDSKPPLDTDALIAEIDGVAVAALSLTSGRTVADPFVRTTSVCDLLRTRAASIARPREQERRLQRLFRLVPVGARQL
jgi:hypothetical protein